MKVLLVDDDKSTLTMLRLHLCRADCQITSTVDADEALALLKEADFDWLVVDGQIGSRNGFDLAAKAKELRPGLRIVMISGIYEPADIAAHPIGRLFPKPVDTDALVSYLRAPAAGSL